MLGIWQMNKIGPRMIPFTLISALTSSLHAEQVSQDQEPRELKSKAWQFLSLLKAKWKFTICEEYYSLCLPLTYNK